MLADACMSIASLIFIGSAIFQIFEIHEKKCADQISWSFLALMILAIILYVIGKLLVGCYIAAMVDCLSLVAYCILGFLKAYFAPRRSSYVLNNILKRM